MSIQVGIVENMIISTVEKSKEGTLNITLKMAPEATAATTAPGAGDIFGELNDTSEGGGATNELRYIHWPFKIDEYTKTPDDVLTAIKRSKEFLNHILKQYMTEDKITWNVMAGINLDQSNPAASRQQLMVESVLNKIYDNQILQFIGMMQPHLAVATPLRVKLTRQSKAKHYASLPRFAPFLESMSVAKAQSKLYFTKWEKENGFDSGAPIAEEATAPDAAPEVSASADAVFGNN
jgi:hypothetical protein